MYASLVKPEPVENATFLLTLLAGFAFLSTAAWATINVKFNRTARILFWALITCALCGAVAWAVASLRRPRTFSFQVAGIVAPAILADPMKFAFLTVVFAALIAGVAMLPATGKWRFVPGSLAAVALAILARFSILGNDDYYPAHMHYEVFVYPLVQDWLGSGIHLGSDGQKSQYGLYPILLRPIWYLIGGPSTVTITVVMAALLLISFLLILVFITRFTKHPTLAAVLTLAAIMGGLLIFPMWPLDPFFQFFPVRLLFPSIALGLVCWKATRVDYSFLSYVVLAIGLVWNFESGVVGLVTFGVFVLAAETRPGLSEMVRIVLRQAFLAATAMAAVAAGVVIYYLARFGSAPNFLGHLHSVRAFSSGIGAIPMPGFGKWGLHFLVYSISVFVGLRSLWSSIGSQERQRAAALLAMTAAGIVWFRYYQGRSAPPQLQLVSLPAFCCSALLVDRILRAYHSRQWASVVVSVAVGAPLAATLSVWWLSPYSHLRTLNSIARSSHPDATWNRASDEAIEAFEKVKQQDSDGLLVLAPYAHLVSLKRGKPSPIHAAGLCQIWFESELAEVMRVVSSPSTLMVVVDVTSTCAPLQNSENAIYEEDFLGFSYGFRPSRSQHDALDALTVGIYSTKVYPDQERLEPRLADLLRREFLEVTPRREFEEDDCSEQHPMFFVRKGIPLKQFRTTGEMTNIAKGKRATQSTSLAGTSPSLAVDGNTDGIFANGSTTHTELQQGPWWEVDLGAERDISSIEIWNRTDCCGVRLRNFWVLASDKRFPPDSAAASLANLPGVHSAFRATSCRMTRIKAGFTSRFVRVQLDGTDYLSLAEVRVLSK
jgi:F5/8 type C domain